VSDQLSVERLAGLRGAPVCDSAGEKIGSVEEIFYDDQSRRPEWLGIGTGFFKTKRVLVPMEGARISDEQVIVAYSKDRVKDSPAIDEEHISEQTEQELAAYYGRGELPRDGKKPRGKTDESLTRSEEELQVGKREVEAGRVRLCKWVETEPVEEDVELRRETAQVTRERIDQPAGDQAIGEEEVEVTLREEQPVVAKQTVAKERIGVEKDVRTERETVSDEVRKERVDIDEDTERR
jgi:uncharacterized protein (TIGR02271 family)